MLLMFRLYASPHRVSIAMRRGSCELSGARPEGGEVAGGHDKSDLFNDGRLPVLNAVL